MNEKPIFESKTNITGMHFRILPAGVCDYLHGEEWVRQKEEDNEFFGMVKEIARLHALAFPPEPELPEPPEGMRWEMVDVDDWYEYVECDWVINSTGIWASDSGPSPHVRGQLTACARIRGFVLRPVPLDPLEGLQRRAQRCIDYVDQEQIVHFEDPVKILRDLANLKREGS